MSSTPDAVNIPDHELVHMIGRGSYGEVWLARNVTGKGRAVKIVRRDALGDAQPYEREYAAIQRYESVSCRADGLVNVLHIGRAADNRYFYYVMELADPAPPAVDGIPYEPRTLRGDMQRLGALPLDACAPIARELAGALRTLHGAGLVHRDIKPANIIFIRDAPKFADIGLVGELGSTRSFVGTEGYIPPEGPGGPQADVFGLAMVLYEAATGFAVTRFPEVPREWLTAGSREMAFFKIIARAGEHDVTRRYRSADEMLRDIAAFESGASPPAAPSRRVWKIAALIALLGAAFSAWHFHERRPPPAITATADWQLAGRLLREDKMPELRAVLQKLAATAGHPQSARDLAVRLLATHSVKGQPICRLITPPLADDAKTPTAPHTISISPERNLLALGSATGLDLLHLPDGKLTERLLRAPVVRALFTPDGRALFATVADRADAGLHHWTFIGAPTGALQIQNESVLGPAIPTRQLAFGLKPAGIAEISGPDSVVGILRIGRKTTRMPASEGSQNIALNSGGLMVAADNAERNVVRVWKTDDGTSLAELPTDGPAGVRFALGDSLLVLCDRSHITAYQTQDWKMRWQTKREAAPDALPIWISASPEDDVLLLPRAGNRAGLMDAVSGQWLVEIAHPSGSALIAAEYSSRENRLAFACDSAPLQIWNLTLLRTQLQRLDLVW